MFTTKALTVFSEWIFLFFRTSLELLSAAEKLSLAIMPIWTRIVR